MSVRIVVRRWLPKGDDSCLDRISEADCNYIENILSGSIFGGRDMKGVTEQKLVEIVCEITVEDV